MAHAPEEKIVCFEFHLTRGHGPPKELLDGFKGVLQTDGWRALRNGAESSAWSPDRARCLYGALPPRFPSKHSKLTTSACRPVSGPLRQALRHRSRADQRRLRLPGIAVRSERSVPVLLKLHQKP